MLYLYIVRENSWSKLQNNHELSDEWFNIIMIYVICVLNSDIIYEIYN